MSDLRYEPIHGIPRERLVEDLESNNRQTAANARYTATKYEEDTDWVQDQCLRKLTSPALAVRWAAATCLGDLAFLRRPLNAQLVTAALERAAQGQTIVEPAKFSLSMVKEFLSS